jgi:UPF0271 protein
MPVHIIDANVLIHGSERELPFDRMLTVPSVTDELESFRAQQRFESDDIQIREPEQAYINTVKDRADDIGADISATDIKLIALALQEDGILVTDDYGMQNLAQHLDIQTEPFLKDGIDTTEEWTRICTNCGQEVDGPTCPICGAETEKTSG